MPYQAPSLAAACMILLAAPKLVMAIIPSQVATEQLRARMLESEPEEEVVPFPITPGDTTPMIPTPGSITPISPPEPDIFYAAQGCYKEPKKGRALEHVWVQEDMTPELCAEHAVNYAYYGVEYGIECWYGNTLRKGSTQVADDECTKPCPGDAEQTCGGGMRLNLWRRTDASVPLDQPKVGDYDLQGCYVDTLNPRALRRVLGHDEMTPQMCSDFCAGST